MGGTEAFVILSSALAIASVGWSICAVRRMRNRTYTTMLEESQRLAKLGSWCLDLSSGAMTWSPQLYVLLDLDPATAPSLQALIDRVHPDDRSAKSATTESEIVDTEQAEPDQWKLLDGRFRIPTDTGDARILQGAVTVILDRRGQPRRVVGTVSDVVAEYRTSQRLAAELRTVIDAIPDAIFSVTPDDVVREWNPAAARMFGYTADEIVGHSGSVLLPRTTTNAPSSWSDQFVDRLPAASGTADGVETVIVHKDGHKVPIVVAMMPIRDEYGTFLGGTIIARDITRRRKLEDLVSQYVNTDLLTGLASREVLFDRLRDTLAGERKPAVFIALFFIDLDDFKFVNDTLGHQSGDRVLVTVAERLRSYCQPGDTVARLGGDEFAIVLPAVTEMDAHQFAERLVNVLRLGVDLGGTVASTRASIGVVLHPWDSPDTPETLLRQADLAMYAAKREERGSYRIFADEIQSAFTRRVELELDLRQAVVSDQFYLHYQPIVSLAADKITGFEALLRWNRPGRESVGPEVFIPILESTGLIMEIGKFVLYQACRQAAAWQTDPGVAISISVNVSPHQLNDPRFVDHVKDALNASGLPPSHLTLEITEGVMVANIEQVTEKLHQLRKLGVRMAIDDFGTGYSSLKYLQVLPVDFVKIDRAFIAKIQGDPGQAALAKAIVGVGHALNLAVVAEGVETVEQARLLHAIGCEYGQGFHFARPQDATMATALLAKYAVTAPDPEP